MGIEVGNLCTSVTAALRTGRMRIETTGLGSLVCPKVEEASLTKLMFLIKFYRDRVLGNTG